MSVTIANGIKGGIPPDIEAGAREVMSKNPGIGYEKIAPPNSSWIKVIIVAAGFAGLLCAIECKRKGHEVIILERFSELKILGEF
ncbi:hypothetical protein ACEPAF_7188 [Sanghuangporus sanghuang]